MARRTVVELVDDLDGSPAAATVRFGYDGQDYEIALSEEHAAELDEFLAPYLEHARRISDGGRAGRGRRPPRQPRPDTTALGQRHHPRLGVGQPVGTRPGVPEFGCIGGVSGTSTSNLSIASSRHPHSHDPRAVPNASSPATGEASPATGPHVRSNTSRITVR